MRRELPHFVPHAMWLSDFVHMICNKNVSQCTIDTFLFNFLFIDQLTLYDILYS